MLTREGGERKEGLKLTCALESQLGFIAVVYMRLCKVLKIVSVFHPITTLPSSLFISLPSKWTPGRQSERQCQGVGVEHPSGLGAEASCA